MSTQGPAPLLGRDAWGRDGCDPSACRLQLERTTEQTGYVDRLQTYSRNKSEARSRHSRPAALHAAPAGWSIWVGIAISARSNDPRVAQQLGMLASLPSVAVTSLIAFDGIHATLGLALGLAALLLLDGLGWRITSATFDRERLITGTR